MKCKSCDSDNLEYCGINYVSGIFFDDYKCSDCGNITSVKEEDNEWEE